MAITFVPKTKVKEPVLGPGGKRAFTSLKELTVEQRAAIETYLIAGTSIDRVVDIIKDEWGALEPATKPSVRRMLYRFREKNLMLQQAKLASKFSTSKDLKTLASKITELETRINPVMMLEELVTKQHLRLQKMEKTEAQAPTLLDVQTKNIDLMSNMLSKLLDAQLETGVLRRVPRKLDLATVDITEEERQFMTNAKLADSRAGFLIDAMRMLKNEGVVDVQSREVHDSGS